MMAAKMCNVPLEEVLFNKSEADFQLECGVGLKNNEGKLLTQTTAILEQIVPRGHAILGGSDAF